MADDFKRHQQRQNYNETVVCVHREGVDEILFEGGTHFCPLKVKYTKFSAELNMRSQESISHALFAAATVTGESLGLLTAIITDTFRPPIYKQLKDFKD